jgi:hypothetical protein
METILGWQLSFPLSNCGSTGIKRKGTPYLTSISSFLPLQRMRVAVHLPLRKHLPGKHQRTGVYEPRRRGPVYRRI